MRFPKQIGVLCLSLIAIAAGAHAAQKQPTGSYFAGRTVTIVVGSSPSGIYDTYAHLLGRYLGSHIPGSPNVVVTSMSGADGEIGASYVAHVAPKDGTYIAATTQTQPLQPILANADEINYDPSRMNYLGTPSSDVTLCIVRSDAPVTRFADMLKTPLILGGTAANGPLGYLPIALDNVLGAKFKVVLGYPGIGDVILAMRRRETSGLCGISWATLMPHYADLLEKHEVVLAVQASDKGRPELDAMGVPLTSAFTQDERKKRILSIIYSQEIFARPYFVAAEAPKDRVETLRRAFMDAWADPDLRADASKIGLPVDPVSGQDIQAVLEKVYASPPDLLAAAKAAIRAK
jgi:tripartite-type tricarboxylate transporter receptor subunit TctC